MKTFSSAEVCAEADITYRQLDYWCRIGLIPGGTPGSGRYRRYTAEQLKEVKALGRRVKRARSGLNQVGLRR